MKVLNLLAIICFMVISVDAMAIVDDCFGPPTGETKPNNPDQDIHIFDPAGDPVNQTEPGTNLPL